MTNKGMVHFIGAGPGDPELITVRGQKIVSEADVVIYAGSLVREEILNFAPEHAECHNSAVLKLDQQVAIMKEAVNAGRSVARLHTGDPSIYGAIAEQMKALDRLEIPYRVVPGVSSAFAAAAALKLELTIPEHTQTIILTRLSGRTKVPDREALSKLAAHRSSLMIFLSAGMIERVVDELRAAGYSGDTLIAVACRVTWPDEKIIKGTLADIAQKMLAAEVTHHALIVVSPSLKPELTKEVPLSHLYGQALDSTARDDHIAIVALTRNGIKTGKRLLDGMENALLYAPERLLGIDLTDTRIKPTITSIRQTLQSAFSQHKALVCIMASGIVIREIAPLLKSKHADPAVVVVDEAGKFAVSLLSGHKGGANELAAWCAYLLDGQAVITTASDTQGLPSLDLLADQHGWVQMPTKHLTALSGAMVNGEPIAIYQDCGSQDWLPDPLPRHFKRINSAEKLLSSALPYAITITYQDSHNQLEQTGKKALVLHPPCLHVGIGCNRDTPAEEITQAINEIFNEYGISRNCIASIASIDIKADEQGLLEVCEDNQWPLRVFTSADLATVENLPNPSPYAEKCVGAPGVAEPAALLAARSTGWLVEKQKFPNVTIAVALEEVE
jgi:precorrin-4 C11-methyltransferase